MVYREQHSCSRWAVCWYPRSGYPGSGPSPARNTFDLPYVLRDLHTDSGLVLGLYLAILGSAVPALHLLMSSCTSTHAGMMVRRSSAPSSHRE